MRQVLARLATPTSAILLLVFMALFFNWPYLMGGFAGDDIIFLNILEEDPQPFSRWLGMWSIAASDWKFLDYLWWKDWTSSSSSGFFWRPVPSIIFEGFVGVFADNPLPLHILLLLIHAGVGVGLYLFVRKLTGRHWLALAAGLLFVACEDHSMLLGWITAFTGPLAALFTVYALLAHVHWLQHRRAGALISSVSMLALALACKESASVAPLLLVLLTFFMPTGWPDALEAHESMKGRVRAFVRDPWSWIPAATVLIVYLVAYRSLGLGAVRSLMYVSPFTDPLGYMSHLVVHLPVMWLGALSPIPPFMLLFAPSMMWIAALLGAMLLIIWSLALRSFRNRPLIVWAGLAFLIALLPEMAADASERGLYLAMVPASVLLAMILLTIGPIARRLSSEPPEVGRYTRVVGWLTLWLILIPGTFLSLTMPWAYLPGLVKPELELRTALPHVASQEQEHVFVLNTSGFMLTIYTYDALNYLIDEPLDVWVLSSANGVFSAEKVGDSSLVIRTDRSGWLSNMFAGLIRTKAHLNEGSRFETAVFTATLSKLTKSATDVLEVRFDFIEPLDFGGYLFLRWNGQAFEPVDFAEISVGERLDLADTSDLMKSMF